MKLLFWCTGGADGNSCRESILTHFALREKRETELENPNCKVSSNIHWGGPVLCLPCLKTFLPPYWQQRGGDAESWHVLGDWQPALGVELAASPVLQGDESGGFVMG